MPHPENFKEALLRKLSRHGFKRASRPVKVTIKLLPFNTDATFQGFRLAQAMCPEISGGGLDTQMLFDTWLWPVYQQEGDSYQDLAKEGTPQLANWVRRGADFGEQTVRLLVALGNAPGARLEYSPDSIMVHHDGVSYGISNGVGYSRFCDGLKIEVDHMRILTEQPTVVVRNAAFVALWCEAYLKGPQTVSALIAYYQRNPVANWTMIAQTARDYMGTKMKTSFGRWVKMLDLDHDPIPALYKAMVPKWITQTEFNRLIAPVAFAPVDPDRSTRQMYINKLYNLIYKNNKERGAEWQHG